MGKISFNKIMWIWVLGWIPLSLTIGYIVFLLDWHKTIHPLIDVVITTVIFLIYIVPLISHLENE
jgi:hypothetical protein